MRYVFVFLFALVFSCGVAPFADGRTPPPDSGLLEEMPPPLDSKPSLSSPEEMQSEMRSVVVDDATTPATEERKYKQMKRATEERTCPPAGSQPVQLMWFTTSNADHACGGQLVISNVPFGVWLEIGGSFYHHKDTSGMKHVIVEGFLGFEQPEFLRTGRSSYAIRSTNAKSATVQLLADQAVYLDWTREFISLDHQVDKSDGVFSLASMTPAIRTKVRMPVATTSVRTTQPTVEELKIATAQVPGEVLFLEVDRSGAYKVKIPDSNTDAKIRLLQISGELERLKTLTKKCFLKGKASIKFTNAAGQESTFNLKNFQLELNLAKGSDEPDKESLVASLTAAGFLEAIKKEEEKIGSLIQNAAPISGEQTIIVFSFSGPNQIGFNNQILEDDASFETGNSIAEDITIGVKVKLKAPAP